MLYSRRWTVLMVTVIVLAVHSKGVSGRSVGGSNELLAEVGAISSSSSSSPSSSSSSSESSEHRITKRSFQDSSCKGLESPVLWQKLSRACNDCQNLFRENSVEKECRNGCFNSDVFTDCVHSLKLNVEEYVNDAKLLRQI